MTTQERIKADAAKYCKGVTNSFKVHTMTNAYITGATAEHDRAQAAIDILEQIANAPVPTNEIEKISWIETARLLAMTAIEQWKTGKEVGDEG